MEKSFYNKFKQNLGASDAINEYTEVLLRQFENNPHDENSFQNIASGYGIKVNDVSPKVAIDRIREYYIVSVFQLFEEFLNQLNSFLKNFGKYKERKETSISMLQHIHSSLLGMQSTSDESYLLFLICDYYRLVRNLCTHTDNEKKSRMRIRRFLNKTMKKL